MSTSSITTRSLAPGIILHTLETPSIGNRSYLVEQEGWAVAIDVERDTQTIAEILEQRGLRLGAVVETHLHNDYLSGGWALGQQRDAEYMVPRGPKYAVPSRATRDGEYGGIRSYPTSRYRDTWSHRCSPVSGHPRCAR